MEQEPKNENQIIEASTEVIRRLMTDDYPTYESIVGDKIIDLKQRYGESDVYKYRLFHVLIGSSNTSGIEYFDFPGEDSVESFIRSL